MEIPESNISPMSMTLEQLVRSITSPDYSINSTEILLDRLLEVVTTTIEQNPELPNQIFKVLFRLPICKNPIIAFKAMTLLYRLVSEGPAKLTTFTISNDGFLSWIESSWTNEKTQLKKNEYSNLFVKGDISLYCKILKNRCSCHITYSSSFTTHWMLRITSNSISDLLNLDKKIDAFQSISSALLNCIQLIHFILTTPSTNLYVTDMKQAAIPNLVLEISKTYLVLSWLYLISNDSFKNNFKNQLSHVHTSTKHCFDQILELDDIASKCHPSCDLNLPDQLTIPSDEQQLITKLKAFRKKKKKKSWKKDKVHDQDRRQQEHDSPSAPPLRFNGTQALNGNGHSDSNSRQDSDHDSSSPPNPNVRRKVRTLGRNYRAGSETDGISPRQRVYSDLSANKSKPRYAANEGTVISSNDRLPAIPRRDNVYPVAESRRPIGSQQHYATESRFDGGYSRERGPQDWRRRQQYSVDSGRAPGPPTNGLKKLSVSVRRGHDTQHHHAAGTGHFHNGTRNDVERDDYEWSDGTENDREGYKKGTNGFHKKGVDYGDDYQEKNILPLNENGRRKQRSQKNEDYEWISDEEENSRRSRELNGNGAIKDADRSNGMKLSRKNGTKAKAKHNGKNSRKGSHEYESESQTETETESESEESSDEESEEEEEESNDINQVKKPRKKKLAEKKRKQSMNGKAISNGSASGRKKNMDRDGRGKSAANGTNKNGRKDHRFLAEQPEEDYSGGSKEALAAAAQGRKTPMINSDYEIAPYEVQYGPQIGSGGFGVVYKAKFRQETVAVKRIHAHALSNAGSVAEFQSEVAVLCTLNHPNILRFVGACTKPPNLMILTEFMGRGTLFDLLHQSQVKVTWSMRKKFALDTCRGMKYLHDSKLLHRDLKSSNLMLDKDLNCKVGDFGLTRISKGSAAVQMTGQCGTFQYMAVEVLANKPYSEKADVFSFGILLWEMIARKLPYFGMQPMQVGIAVLQQGLRPTIPPRTPAPLIKMMTACWDNDPDRRPSFTQLVEALDKMPE